MIHEEETEPPSSIVTTTESFETVEEWIPCSSTILMQKNRPVFAVDPEFERTYNPGWRFTVAVGPCRGGQKPRSVQMKQRLALLVFVLTLGLSAALVWTTSSPPDTAPDQGLGSSKFLDHCSACHQPDGRGTTDGPPPLQGSAWLEESETRLVKIVLNGLGGFIEVAGKTYNLEMPSFREVLTDEEIAAVLSFVRRNWGSSDLPISPLLVGTVREATRDRNSYWTVDELLADR